MNAVPLIAVAATHAGQIRTCALGAPLEGTVVDEFTRQRVRTVAQGFSAEGANHLRVAVVATFAHIHITANHLQCGVGLETRHRLGGGFLEEQGHDFDHATDQQDDEDQNDHQKVVGLDFLMGQAA